jgi:TonB family protein
MKRTTSTPILLPLALLSTALVTPAYANWFHDSRANINRNIGSAPNPTPDDVRENRSPAYPLVSRSLNEQGTVGLTISLNELGAVSGAVIERTSGFDRLDDAAVQYAKTNWIYTPTINDGRPMPSVVDVNVTFTLK